jgi:adenylate cyclase
LSHATFLKIESKFLKKPVLDPADISRIVEMAWEDRTPFDAIEASYGLNESRVIDLMRSEMKPSSFRMWRKRVTGRGTKHASRRPDDVKLGSMLMVEDISSAKRMKSTMSRYMDPVIAAQMMDGDALDLLGGVSAEATIMFTDVRGFTTITEEYGAQGTVSFLNEYFSLMVDCITAQGGMLDKFIGDAIMACFGLPVPHDDDPDRAARAAITMIKTLWEWNAERRDKGLKTVDMGVGIHTDHVVSGNIGSPKRMDYTVIGDGVNLASRLESACKAYSARILASESTISKLNGTYKMRDIDLVVVKGKTAPVRVFELLDYHDAQTFPALRDVLGQFEDGMAAYRAARWDDAIMRFEKCLSLNPGDGLSRTYIERCRLMQANPPQGDWDGVWVMKDK